MEATAIDSYGGPQVLRLRELPVRGLSAGHGPGKVVLEVAP